MPLNLTERMAITYGRMLLRWKCTNEILEDGKSAPAGYTKVSGHLIWSVKMDFTRKARWVLDGHKTPDPVGSKYAGVVSRESVRLPSPMQP